MSIDPWTIGLEVVNFLVLVWLLERLLFRPVLGVVAARQAEIEKLQASDAAEQASLAAAEQRLAEQREALEAERVRALDEARAQAREEGARLEAEARAEADRVVAEARTRIEQERAEAALALRRKSVEIGVALSRRMLALGAPGDASGTFVDAVCERLRALGDDERARISAELERGVPLRIVSATALDDGQRTACTEALAAALGRTVEPIFDIDEALIAGIEVHLPGTVLRHSWRDALEAGEDALLVAANVGLTVDGDGERAPR